MERIVIEKVRFNFNPKEAFKKLQTVTKNHCFEKRDGSIISKMKVGETTISVPNKLSNFMRKRKFHFNQI